jgi:hypothetical protein
MAQVSFPYTLEEGTKAFATQVMANFNVLKNLINQGIENDNLKNLAVTTEKIADLAITTAKIATSAVTTDKITDSNVTTTKIADLAITTLKLADACITNTKLALNSVDTDNIIDYAVTTSKLNDLAITTGKLADLVVTEAKLGNLSVSTGKLKDLAVTTAKIANSAVTTDKLANNSVTTEKLVNSSVTTDKITNGAVTGDKIGTYAVTVDKLHPEVAEMAGDAALKAQLTDMNTQTATFPHGASVLEVPQASPVDVALEGRTLVNLLGRNGNAGEVLWTLKGSNVSSVSEDTSVYVIGEKSQKVTVLASAGNRYVRYLFDYKLESNKDYLIMLMLRRSVSGNIAVKLYQGTGLTTVVTSKTFTLNTNEWTLAYWKYNSTVDDTFSIVIDALGSDVIDYWFDGVRLYEIPQEIYDKIDVDPEYTGDKLAEKFPYVDSVQHIQNPYVIARGKNLLPPFTQCITINSAGIKEIIEPYKLKITKTATGWRIERVELNIAENTTYTASYTLEASDVVGSGAYLEIKYYDKDNIQIGMWENSLLTSSQYYFKTFTTPQGTAKLQVNFNVHSDTTGTFIFSNPQLELGDTATTFEPANDSYLYLPDVKLASSIDGTVKDTLQKIGKDYVVTHRWQKDVVLDGSWDYTFRGNYTGFKLVSVANNELPNFGMDDTKNDGFCVKYNGNVLLNGVALEGANRFDGDVSWGGADVAFSVSNTDSGWGDSYTPSATEIKAYFYGWQMNNGTYGTPYNGTGTKTWIPLGDTDNTRATTTLPTSPSPTIEDGTIDYYKLTYQLATPVSETIIPEGALSIHAGQNQIEVGEGVIVREQVTPILGPTSYNINRIDNSSLSEGALTKRADKIIAIYKNGVKDSNWKIGIYGTPNGNESAVLDISLFDSSATYEVTYLVLDKHLFTTNIPSVTATYQGNLKETVEELVQNVNDLEERQSITERQVSEYLADNAVHGATSDNIANRIVLRDASGNFSAGTITATLNGSADKVDGIHFRIYNGVLQYNDGTGWKNVANTVTVQRGYTLLVIGLTSVNVTISTVDVSKSFVSFGGVKVGDNSVRELPSVRLTSPTTLAIERNSAFGAVTVAWEVTQIA